MRFGFTAVFCACASFPQLALALSISAARPHDPKFACATIEAAVETMVNKRPMGITPLFYTNELGSVSYEERTAFIQSMTRSFGKPDSRALEVTRVYRAPVRLPKGDRSTAWYVVELGRAQWFEGRADDLDGSDIPAGYEPRSSYWLVQFQSEKIYDFREGPYFVFVDHNERLKGCGNG